MRPQNMQINGQNYSELKESGKKVFIPFPKPKKPKQIMRHGKVQVLASGLFT